MKRNIQLIVFFCFLFIIAMEFLHPITALNEDLGRHLKLGEIILSTYHVPTINLFSYAYPSFPFINTHWLSEVIFFCIVHLTGFTPLLLITTTLALITCAILFLANAKAYSPVALGIVSLLTAMMLLERAQVRPELFSYFFLVCFITILYRNRFHATKLLYLLPVIELLWVNMHIYFILGPVLIGFFLLEKVLQQRKSFSFGAIQRLTIVLVLTCVVLCINPHGLPGAVYPFFVFTNYGYPIQENQSIFFIQSQYADPVVVGFEISALLLFIAMLISWKKTSLVDWCIVIFFSYLGVSALRNVALFPLATFGILVALIDGVTRQIKQLPLIAKHERAIHLSLFLLLGTIGVWELFFFSSLRPFGFYVDAKGQDAMHFFTTAKLHGPIFNNFDIGSYLIYSLYPKEKVFVDGRPEAYPASFFQDLYIPMQQNQELFEKVANHYHFNTIVFAHTDQTPWAKTFLAQISKNPAWKMVYLDSSMVIFLKNIPSNQQLITRYTIGQDTLSLVSIQSKDVVTLTKFAMFLDSIGWQKAEQKVLEEALSKDSHFCPALFQIATVFQEEDNLPLESVYVQRLQAFCQ